MAFNMGLDLVVVSDKSIPPVCRIMDLKKAEYEKKKSQKKSATSEVKEIQLKLNIADHDLTTKINQVRKFIERGDKVKLNIRFKGREREMPERVKAVLARAIAALNIPVKVIPSGYGIVILEKE
jgi:translation initiation factor IF-3